MVRFVRADDLDGLPEPNRRNYLFETRWLEQHLEPGATVLQIGSMDGRRLLSLQEVRPDLRATGLEIDAELVALARRNVEEADSSARIVQGDIANPPEIQHFDWVVCLNHTLGYIEDESAAISNMRRLGDRVCISVYGERFDVRLAARYFGLIREDSTRVRRYTKADVAAWAGMVVETPLGYLAVLDTHNRD